MAGTKHPASDDASFSLPTKRIDSRYSPTRRGSTYRPDYGGSSSTTSTPRNRSPTRRISGSDLSTRPNLPVPAPISATEIGERLGTFLNALTAEAQASFYRSYAAGNVEICEKEIKDSKRHYHDFPPIEVQQSAALADAKKTLDKHNGDCDFLGRQRAIAAEAFTDSVTRGVVAAPVESTRFEVARIEKLELGLEAVLGQLKTTQEEVSTLRTENGILKDAIATKNSGIESRKTEVQDLATLNAETQEFIKRLENNNRNLESQNISLTNEMAQTKEINNSIKGTLGTLEKQIGVIEGVLAMVDDDIDHAVKPQIKAVEDTLTTTVPEIEEKVRLITEDIGVLQAKLSNYEIPPQAQGEVGRNQENVPVGISATLSSIREDITQLQGDHEINAEALEGIQDKVHRVEDEVYGMQDSSTHGETLFAHVSELKTRQDQASDGWDYALNESFERIHEEILLARVEMRDTIRVALEDQAAIKYKDEFKYLHESLEKQHALNETFATTNEQELSRNSLTQLKFEIAALKTAMDSMDDGSRKDDEKEDNRKDGDDKKRERQTEQRANHPTELQKPPHYPPTPPTLQTPVLRSQSSPLDPTNQHHSAVARLPSSTVPDMRFDQHYLHTQGHPLSSELDHFIEHFNKYITHVGARMNNLENNQSYLNRRQQDLYSNTGNVVTTVKKKLKDLNDAIANTMRIISQERNDKLMLEQHITERFGENAIFWQRLEDAGIWNLPTALGTAVNSRNADVKAIKEEFVNVRAGFDAIRPAWQGELSSHLQSYTIAHNELKIDVQTKHQSLEEALQTYKKEYTASLDELKPNLSTSETLALEIEEVRQTLEGQSKSLQDLTSETAKLSGCQADLNSVQTLSLKFCSDTTSWVEDMKQPFAKLRQSFEEQSTRLQDVEVKTQKIDEWQTVTRPVIKDLFKSNEKMEESISGHDAKPVESQKAVQALHEEQSKTMTQHGRIEQVMQSRLSKHDEGLTELHKSVTGLSTSVTDLSKAHEERLTELKKSATGLSTLVTDLSKAHDLVATMAELHNNDLKKKDEDIANWMLSLGKVEKRIEVLEGVKKVAKTASSTAPFSTYTLVPKGPNPNLRPPTPSTAGGAADKKPIHSSRKHLRNPLDDLPKEERLQNKFVRQGTTPGPAAKKVKRHIDLTEDD